MGNKNSYLERRNAVYQQMLDTGEELGVQKMWDYVQIALRDPEVMDKDVFGRQRIEKIYKRCQALAEHFKTAFTDDKEADVKQEELDQVLKEIWGKDLCKFGERYPMLKKIDYSKPKKNWR